MLDIMFDLPSRTDVREVVIREDCIRSGAPPLLILEPEEKRREASAGGL
jgi:ATP-dependent protease Clp ATPase subunit